VGLAWEQFYNKVSIYINLAHCSRETENARDVPNLKIAFPRAKKLNRQKLLAFLYISVQILYHS
jgi:hypothetical protein